MSESATQGYPAMPPAKGHDAMRFAPGAGWHPDPDAPGRALRYFDGTGWTEQRVFGRDTELLEKILAWTRAVWFALLGIWLVLVIPYVISFMQSTGRR